jgi:hypothetical protein
VMNLHTCVVAFDVISSDIPAFIVKQTVGIPVPSVSLDSQATF